MVPSLWHTAVFCPSWMFSSMFIVLQYRVAGSTFDWSLRMGHVCIASPRRGSQDTLGNVRGVCVAQQLRCHHTSVTQPCGTPDAPHSGGASAGRVAPQRGEGRWEWFTSCFSLAAYQRITEEAQRGLRDNTNFQDSRNVQGRKGCWPPCPPSLLPPRGAQQPLRPGLYAQVSP